MPPKQHRRRVRRIVEFGRNSLPRPDYTADEWGGLYEDSGTAIDRKIERALKGGKRIAYYGIDPAAKPKLEIHRGPDQKRRAVVSLKRGVYQSFPYPFRNSSVDEVHFHMIPDQSNIDREEAVKVRNELARILKPGGRIYFTGQNNVAHVNDAKTLMEFYKGKQFRIRHIAIRPEGWEEALHYPTQEQYLEVLHRRGVRAKKALYAESGGERGWFSLFQNRHPKNAAKAVKRLSDWGGNYATILAILEKRKQARP